MAQSDALGEAGPRGPGWTPGEGEPGEMKCRVFWWLSPYCDLLPSRMGVTPQFLQFRAPYLQFNSNLEKKRTDLPKVTAFLVRPHWASCLHAGPVPYPGAACRTISPRAPCVIPGTRPLLA